MSACPPPARAAVALGHGYTVRGGFLYEGTAVSEFLQQSEEC